MLFDGAVEWAERQLDADLGAMLAAGKELERAFSCSATARGVPLARLVEIVDQLTQGQSHHFIRLETQQVGRRGIPQRDATGLGVGHDDRVADAGEEPAGAQVEPAVGRSVRVGREVEVGGGVHEGSLPTIGRAVFGTSPYRNEEVTVSLQFGHALNRSATVAHQKPRLETLA